MLFLRRPTAEAIRAFLARQARLDLTYSAVGATTTNPPAGYVVDRNRLVVPAGKQIDEHKAKGEIVVQCLEGKVAFTAFGTTQHLEAGNLLYLPTGEPHTVKGIENASLLLTVLLPKH